MAEAGIIRYGNSEYLLDAFGTRDGEYYKNSDWVVDEIVVYHDSTLLESVTLIDIPGFDTDNKADDIGLAMEPESFDMIFFTSTADAFLRGVELAAVSNFLQRREVFRDEELEDGEEKLPSFYLLATHVQSIGKTAEDLEMLENIKAKGCERIVNVMPDDWNSKLGTKKASEGSESNYDALLKRCFSFDMYDSDMCNRLNTQIRKDIVQLIKHRSKTAYANADNWTGDYLSELEGLLKIEEEDYINLTDKKAQKLIISQLEASRASSINHLAEIRLKMQESISRRKKDSVTAMNEAYNSIVNEDTIIWLIKKRGYKNRKKDIEDLSNSISNEIDSKLKSILTKQGKEFAEELDGELKIYKDQIISESKKTGVNIGFEYFDFNRAFATGLAGVGAYGALALWASIVAGGSNLGAYILVAKVVSALSSLGISVGGTAAASAFVASIGGPITLAVSIAALAAVTTFGVLTGNWENRLAKKIVNHYNEQRVIVSCKNSIVDFWNDTEKAFNQCIKSLEKEVNERFDAKIKEASDPVKAEEKIKTSICTKMIYNKAVDGLNKMSDLLSTRPAEPAK